MKYAFIRNYNPSYDYFLTRYFKDSGIQFDENSTYSEVGQRDDFAYDMKSMTPEEKLFHDYVSWWRQHPEVRPAYYSLFDRTIGGNTRPDIRKLRELEKGLQREQRKLIFSMDEAAMTISEFYRKQVRNPLEREISEKGWMRGI